MSSIPNSEYPPEISPNPLYNTPLGSLDYSSYGLRCDFPNGESRSIAKKKAKDLRQSAFATNDIYILFGGGNLAPLTQRVHVSNN